MNSTEVPEAVTAAPPSFWIDGDKADFKALHTGQLTLDYVEGHYITQLLRMECGKRVRTLVEIGTWNGLGSTVCILEGIKDRAYTSFHSLECNKEKLEQARENLKAQLSNKIHLVWGTILPKHYFSLDVIERLFPIVQQSDDLRQFMQVDISNCLLAPNVLDQIPQDIDFLLLDGGDFTTLQEFQILLPRCTAYIALDDTRLEKCKRVREILAELPEWSEIYSSDGRNGFSVFEKIR